MNTFWFVGVTMTTVGYGDYFPKTISGRLFSFIIFIWGIFFISVAFVSLINIIQLSINEQNALNIIKKLLKIKELKDKAAHMITNSLKLHILKKKLKKGETSLKNRIAVLYIDNKLKILGLEFKKVKRVLAQLKDDLDFLQYLVNNIDYLNYILLDIEKNQSVILEKVIVMREEVLKHRNTHNDDSQREE